MAKAFYTQEEAESALNTDDNGLKDLVREGRLTEYRDGQNLMYKGTQVETLAGELGGGDEINLSDTGGPIGLADSAGASGSVGAIGLADSGPPAAASVVAEPSLDSDDTGTGFELGDSDAGVDPVAGNTFADSAAMGDSGITIFGPDDSGIADAGAQTTLGDSSGEQVNLEGIGSGSGLLDLTQEPDDTSFGAETFDEIMPGESGMGTAVGAAYDEDAGIDTAAAPVGTRAVGTVYEPLDTAAPIFGGLAAGAAAAVLVGLLAVAGAATGSLPGMLGFFFDAGGNVALGPTLGVLLGLPILGLIVGLVGGRMANG